MNINSIKQNHSIFKTWTSLIVNKLYHFNSNTLPLDMIVFINKCVEFNLLNYSEYYMLKKYDNLPDHE